LKCGIIGRTIGGPYAVLVAEQLHTAGVILIIGLTSAGRIAVDLPLSGLVVATSAIRDEGTSYHYLAPEEEEATCPSHLTLPIAGNSPASVCPCGWDKYGRPMRPTEKPANSL